VAFFRGMHIANQLMFGKKHWQAGFCQDNI